MGKITIRRAQVIGSIDVSLSVSAFCSQKLEVRMFDALGNSVLALDMTDNHKQFDQRRLEPGDYLLAFRSPGPGAAGEGSRNVPNSRLLSELPQKPLLDDILSQPSSEFGDVAVPQFRFSS